jgi:pimeloyl-ACP methyl ester carboxylesterase
MGESAHTVESDGGIDLRTPSGTTIRVESWGDPTAPPVLLGHGGGQTRHAWGNAAAQIAAAGWRAMAFDLRGHGESSWAPDGDYTLVRFLEDFETITAHCGRPPVLVGASLSGVIGLVLAGEHRGTPLRGLVLVDVTPTLDPRGVDRIVGFMRAHLAEGFETIEHAARSIAAYLPHRRPPRDLSGLAKNLRRDEHGRYRWHWDPRFIQGKLRTGLEDYRERILAAARALDVPTLLVRGRMSELVTEEAVAEFRQLVPHASYRDVSDAGHMIAGDRNDAFVAAVLEFLRSLPPEPARAGKGDTSPR